MKIVKFIIDAPESVLTRETSLESFILAQNPELNEFSFFDLHTDWILNGDLLAVIRIPENNALSVYFITNDTSASTFLTHVNNIRTLYMSEISSPAVLIEDMTNTEISDLFAQEVYHTKALFSNLEA